MNCYAKWLLYDLMRRFSTDQLLDKNLLVFADSTDTQTIILSVGYLNDSVKVNNLSSLSCRQVRIIFVLSRSVLPHVPHAFF